MNILYHLLKDDIDTSTSNQNDESIDDLVNYANELYQARYTHSKKGSTPH